MASKKKPEVREPESTLPERIKFKYLFPDDYAPHYANGAQASITPQSELAIHFYVERSPLPYSETHAVAAGGKIGEPIEREPEQDSGEAFVVRQLTTGVILSPSTAARVYELLGRLLGKLAETQEQQGDK